LKTFKSRLPEKSEFSGLIFFIARYTRSSPMSAMHPALNAADFFIGWLKQLNQDKAPARAVLHL